MGTRRSRHNRGRKPLYKEQRLVGPTFFTHAVDSDAATSDPFWLCDAAKALTSEGVRSLSEAMAFEVFKAIRWSKTDSAPQCPHCTNKDAYELAGGRKWACKLCGSQFSATSGTIFASRKMPYAQTLLAIIHLAGGDNSKHVSHASNEIGCNYRTAHVIAAKMRDEATRNEQFVVGKPRYIGGRWLSTRTWWTDAEKAALADFIGEKANPTQAAYALGRSPTSLAHYARDRGIVLPPDWSTIITSRRSPSEQRIALAYPYIITKRPEHADLLAINNLIPKSIAGDMRADMCQEIMLAILEGRATLKELSARSGNAVYFIKKFYSDNFEQGGRAISLTGVGDDDRSYDEVASSIAAKGWFETERHERGRCWGQIERNSLFHPPTQIAETYAQEIRWRRHELERSGRVGLSFDDVEEMVVEGEVTGPLPSLREKSCLRKTRHGTEHAAQWAAVHTGDNDPLHAYRCPYCSGWHVGRRGSGR